MQLPLDQLLLKAKVDIFDPGPDLPQVMAKWSEKFNEG
jgi:hypothetical protein